MALGTLSKLPQKLALSLALTCVLSPGERIFPKHIFRWFVHPAGQSSGLIFRRTREPILPLLGERAGVRADDNTYFTSAASGTAFYFNPSTSCISYRPGFCPATHCAARSAPLANVSRLDALCVSSTRSPVFAKITV